MGESKHTPGPWKVSPTDDTVVIDATGAEVAAVDGDYNAPDTWPQTEANACLIAAAPDLMNALKRAFSYVEAAVAKDGGIEHCQIEYRVDHDAVVAAIAKAEGRS